MSSKGGKWVSQRVQQHQQQVAPPGSAGPGSRPGPAGGNSTSGNNNAGPGSKIMEDSAIAAQRIKEAQATGSRASPATELPATTQFERQEATDALSNFAHNEEATPYEPRKGKVAFEPAQTSEEFHESLMKLLPTLEK